MSLYTFLETLFIGPLKLVFEIIFGAANDIVKHPGVAIIFLSLAMNFLVLPLYRRADAMQEAARDTEARLSKGVSHIKKTFSGDEKMMMLQTYYKQNNYKPTNALNGSVSLLLEIPFFMAAYQFLSNLDVLDGASFGPIADLGAPDGLIVIGSISINLLPILMTVINIISSALYLKGFPLKTKIQLYAMALFFLVFLYTSPSCLVFYWTLNNTFSLAKNIFYKLKNPQKALLGLSTAIGVICLTVSLLYDTGDADVNTFLAVIGAVLLLPIIISTLKQNISLPKKTREYHPSTKTFLLCGLFLSILVGVLIPSAFIAASPQEYVDISYFHNPLWYIVSSGCMAFGTFIVWMGVFYWLATPKGRVIFERIFFALCGITVVNYMFFGTNLGIISHTLQYENGVFFGRKAQVLNVFVILALACIIIFIVKKWQRAVSAVVLTAAVALGGMSAVNVMAINDSVSEVSSTNKEVSSNIPNFALSKDGKNVVVIMLDRAMGEYVPYMFNEKPELKEAFSGFTHYNNVISFGGFTNFGTPALMGGYEYTPVEMNKRDDEPLVEKHNEAVKMMPVLFAENGFDVTVCDPVYPNYKWIPDLSIFDEYSNIDSYITQGFFGNKNQKAQLIQNNHRNFFCLGLMKVMPLCWQGAMYDGGQYNHVVSDFDNTVSMTHKYKGMSESTGLYSPFMECYYVLDNMTEMTNVTNESKDTFLFFTNNITHEPMLLQEPQYVPAQNVNNKKFDKENKDRFNLDGKKLEIKSYQQMIHYQSNMAAFLQLGEWFDYLKTQGVYDNTKIILVSDHGRDLASVKDLIYTDGDGVTHDLMMYSPLLMVKDFNSKEFTTSDDFMTNADVPSLAVKGTLENAKNPFTGKDINDSEKTAHEQFVILSENWNTNSNNGNTFTASAWASFKGGSVRDMNNWSFYNTPTVLKQHKAP